MSRTRSFIVPAVLFICLLAAPHVGGYPVFLMKVMCFALFASAFNLLLGFAGLLSFGHAAFFGGAAYLAGHAVKVWNITPELGLLVGALGGAALGWIFGVLAIRRRGIYFSMITLALAQLVFFLCLQAKFTGGEDGLQGVKRGRLFGLIDLSNDLVMYYFVLGVVSLALLGIMRVVHSPFGQVLKGIRENESRALSLGYDADRIKLLAFVLSAALSGLAGALKTEVLGFATLTDVQWLSSGSAILMTLIGGMGFLSGPLVGATVIVVLENKLGDLGNALTGLTGIEWFGGLGEATSMVTGVLFMACVLAFHRGVVGELLARISRTSSTPK